MNPPAAPPPPATPPRAIPVPAPEVDAFVDALWLEDGLARNTLDAYRRDLKLYADWLHATHGLGVLASAEHHLLGYFAARAATRATSANRRLTVFRRFFR